MVEKIFRQSAEFCGEHEVWEARAHVFFLRVEVQGGDPVLRARGEEDAGGPQISDPALRYYEP